MNILDEILLPLQNGLKGRVPKIKGAIVWSLTIKGVTQIQILIQIGGNFLNLKYSF